MTWFLITLFAFAPYVYAGAAPSGLVNFEDPDISLIENLIREKIDSIRLAHHLRPLRYNFSLNKAAEDHAFYLMARHEVSHYQSFYKKHDVRQRLLYFGAENLGLAGENVLWQHPRRLRKWNPLRKQYEVLFNYTYQSLAGAMVEAWVASPSHYRNILRSRYNTTAVAVAFDTRKKEFLCVQVFAEMGISDRAGKAGSR